MSFEYYAKFWIATRKEIDDVLLREKIIQKIEPTRDSQQVYRITAELYVRYITLVNHLSDIYDQTLQVQKRRVVEKLVEATTKRMLELQQLLKETELCQFTYIDGKMRELKLVPQDIAILRPYYFPIERDPKIQKIIDGREEKPENEKEKELTGIERFIIKLTPQEQEAKKKRVEIIEALNLIKAHEKARQARISQTNFKLHPDKYRPMPIEDIGPDVQYKFHHRKEQMPLYPIKRTVFDWNFYKADKKTESFKYYEKPKRAVPMNRSVIQKSSVKSIKKDNVSIEISLDEFKNEENIIKVQVKAEKYIDLEIIEDFRRKVAANRIKKAWKKYHQNKLDQIEDRKRQMFFNMIPTRKFGEDLISKRIEEGKMKRRKRKKEFDEKLLKAIEDERARILVQKAPWIMEDISDHIREWFKEFYDKAHAFDRYPDVIEGGTLLVIRGETMTPYEYLEWMKKQALNKKKTTEQKKREQEKKKKAKELAKERMMAKKEKARELARQEKVIAAKEGKLYDLSKDTGALLELKETISHYDRDWRFIDEQKNPEEDPVMEFISLDKFAEIHVELRPIVDECMRIEHELLRKALAKDEKKKYKPQKQKKQRRKRGKKGKKKKEPIDLTADQTLTSLYKELVDNKIIRKYPKTSMDDFIGDYNYAAYELRNIYDKEPSPCLGEIRDILRSYILGLGPLNVPKPKSICIAGPPGCGKKLLVNAICTEIDAVLFDLSPETVAPYNDMKFLSNLILKMARKFQPSILFINGAHRPFYRKIPPNEKEFDPLKLGRILLKQILKPIKKDEKIMLIGVTNQPWNCKIGKMKKCFQKILLLPKCDYGSTQLFWFKGLSAKPPIEEPLDFSAISMVTRGHQPEHILKNVDSVLNLNRRMQLSRKKLKEMEFLEDFLAKEPPLYPMTDKEYAKYMKWYRKVDILTKRRNKMIQKRDILKARLNKMKKKK